MIPNKTQYIIGWDIGGAHLKAVLTDHQGMAQQALQVPCPLWRGLDELTLAFKQVMLQLNIVKAQHAITMTGELVDTFENRHNGVLQIAQLMQQLLGDDCVFYAGDTHFLTFEQVAMHTQDIASANWQASANFVATFIDKGLLIDVGSTTADFVLIDDHKTMLNGFNDATRLQTSELLYTGAYRTPVMAIAHLVPFAGDWVHVAAEHFATMADVYRITGDCQDGDDMSDTADGKGKSLAESMTRLARMIGRDRADAPHEAWFGLAFYLKHAQIALLKQAAFRQLSRLPAQTDFCIIGAGAGNFLVRALAQQLGINYNCATELIDANQQSTREAAAICLPAYALANLLNKNA